jgi:hypothetical protein
MDDKKKKVCNWPHIEKEGRIYRGICIIKVKKMLWKGIFFRILTKCFSLYSTHGKIVSQCGCIVWYRVVTCNKERDMKGCKHYYKYEGSQKGHSNPSQTLHFVCS